MNDFSFVSALSITIGVVLLYAVHKNMFPQDVVRGLFGKDPVHGPLAPVKSFGKQLSPSSDTTTPGVVTTSNGIALPGQIVTSV